MTQAAVVANLVPQELSQAATSQQQSAFLTLYGDTLFLLVKLRRADVDLAAGLGATGVRAEAGAAVRPVIGSMNYRTEMLAAPPDLKRPRERGRPSEIMEALAKDRHFGLALRKRRSAEALYPDRISVGRAPNKDIVLRHASVSKSHAWFEMDGDGTWYVADAGSKNLTRLNGLAVVSHEPTPVEAGDRVSFGSIEALVCSPRALWETLSGGAKGGSPDR
jgi:hypothetical protein